MYLYLKKGTVYVIWIWDGLYTMLTENKISK